MPHARAPCRLRTRAARGREARRCGIEGRARHLHTAVTCVDRAHVGSAWTAPRAAQRMTRTPPAKSGLRSFHPLARSSSRCTGGRVGKPERYSSLPERPERSRAPHILHERLLVSGLAVLGAPARLLGHLQEKVGPVEAHLPPHSRWHWGGRASMVLLDTQPRPFPTLRAVRVYRGTHLPFTPLRQRTGPAQLLPVLWCGRTSRGHGRLAATAPNKVLGPAAAKPAVCSAVAPSTLCWGDAGAATGRAPRLEMRAAARHAQQLDHVGLDRIRGRRGQRHDGRPRERARLAADGRASLGARRPTCRCWWRARST